MKPCFGYIRVSTAKQGEGVSLDAQKDAITAFASRENLNIVRWFEEKETAAKRGRPIFNQMIRQLKRGAARGLIMHKIDRSARNLRDWSVITELPDAGIDVHIATETLDFRSRGGRLTADIQAVIAADYIRNLREETIKGLNGRLKQGLYPFRAPIGYLDNGGGKPKTPDPIKAPLIKKMFTLYAGGTLGLRHLQAEMERAGLKSHVGKPLTLSSVAATLSNPFYTGIIEIKRTGKTWQGIHPPLISMRVFQQVQDRKAGRAGKKITRHNHLYRGLFRCGHCGGAMVPEKQKGHVYYRCKTTNCPTKTIREERLEEAIISKLTDLQLSDPQAAALRQDWIDRVEQGEDVAVQRGLELRISECRARLDRLTDLLIDGVLSTSDFNHRKRSLTLELATLQEELANAQKIAVTKADIEQFLERMKNLATLYDFMTEDEQRQLLENAFVVRQVARSQVILHEAKWLASGADETKVPTPAQVVEAIRAFTTELSTRAQPIVRHDHR
jgi:site-specific DNA recombinase